MTALRLTVSTVVVLGGDAVRLAAASADWLIVALVVAAYLVTRALGK